MNAEPSGMLPPARPPVARQDDREMAVLSGKGHPDRPPCREGGGAEAVFAAIEVLRHWGKGLAEYVLVVH